MSVTLEAIFENGSFRPVELVDFPEREHFEITVRRIPQAEISSSKNGEMDPPLPEEESSTEEEYDPRGIVTIDPMREVIDLPSARIEIAAIPQWMPEIVIDPRWLEDVDE